MVDYDAKSAGLTPPCEGIDVCRAKGFSYTNHDISYQQASG